MSHFSIEFFPAKTEVGAGKLREVARRLGELGPEFFSVTYGAGGSTRDRTLGTVKDVLALGYDVAPHLSCIGDSREEIGELLDLYRELGISRIVALRGDLPSGMGRGLGELPYAADLVRYIRERHGDHFRIEVAAYPECHPQSGDLGSDIRHFVTKAQAGADSAITQYFFNADSYFHFVERVRAAGCDIPVIPGIMPITNFANLVRFSDACGAEVPRWVRKQVTAYGDDAASIQQFGEEVVTRLCRQLLDGGAPGLHFYSMNQTEPTLALWRNLGL
ncbi:methylenetetrahydrofolate reductase [NAD(P)H] [Amnimonas aquatica]|uniref:Methylenetetrahydrofolate reductase n=1 Tax=Amnimonas aquatica TaxID=2094561 RepID=A0A2P6AS02_9GAMM|nr:methylenetetrahydrofolate reductase [NAD(P)H] [Amnimonas aquatica]PQA39377.1 methylenetetrahydrofolate reductase [NAD(P)H] [Amnimonas aquatica]